jgi:hypothetical protein
MDLIFKNTPIDIVIQILDYSGIMKYRYGKFMNQLQKNDIRYKMLENNSQFEPVYLYDFSTKPIHYIRDLGKYFVKLQIVNIENTSKFRYIFQRKREKEDTSCITLYYHKLL